MKNSYLIDTDICLFYLKQRHNLNQKFKQIGYSQCAISEITLFEMTYGAYMSQNFERHRKEVHTIQNLFDVIEIKGSMDVYGELKASLRKDGMLIPDFDLLICTTALEQNMTLVTNNEKHFNRFSGLRIEN